MRQCEQLHRRLYMLWHYLKSSFMSKIIYIGNKLNNFNSNITYIELLGRLLESEKFEIIYASDKKNQIIRLLDMIFTVFRNFKSTQNVLIDTYSTSGFWFAFVISQLCRLLKLNYIPILHGGNLPYRLTKNPKYCSMIFNNSKVNVAPSGYLLKAFVDAGFVNTILIPNSIQISDYKFIKKSVEIPKLLWVRSFNEIYNPKMAILVFKEVLKTHANAQLCMVGPNQNNLFLECKQLANSLNLKVKFTGKLSKNQWTELSIDYNMFINTTHFDNTPVSVIEAMALGLIVVSTNVGGIPFLVKDQFSGMLVNDNDVQAMSDSILNLSNKKYLFDQLTTNARNQVEKFDWQIVKKQWLEILN